jgi:hypothetical protein
MSDDYDVVSPLPTSFLALSGPNGPALVRAWPDGRTDQGWGLQGPKSDPRNGFIPRYMRNEFNHRRILFGYEKGKWEFAFVMRSVQMVCIDIDGKNGGLHEAKKLGALPLTMAETSKSGNGYHLFYTLDDVWSHTEGFALVRDRIGIEQGVDIRSTGCVYHHPQQRWNGREPVPLPLQVLEDLVAREQKAAASTARIISVLEGNDETEVLLMQDQLIVDLSKPIPAGKRNNTLFAIGNQMREAKIENWPELVEKRAIDLGLDADETAKLLANIERYGTATAP